MSTCPSPETLEILASDSIGDATFAGIEQHVAGCEQCRCFLEQRASRTCVSADHGLGSTRIDRSLQDHGRMPQPDHLPRIDGFEIKEFLGQGGNGVVYRAWQIKLARDVAIKIVPSGPGTTPRDRERWVRESRAAGKVRHPHVVQLHDAGESGGWLFLVMELSEGGSLKDRLDGPVAPRIAASLLETIAGAVEQIHNNGLLHLDLKPGNILIHAPRELPLELARERVKVTDFGIARLGDELEESTAGTSLARPWGTPWYMSPEQAAGTKAAFSRATDVFALGAIFYELLTGYQPFRSESLMGAFDKIRSQEPAAPRMLDRSIPRDLETICLKCLQKKPGDRYATAQALVDDLRLFLDGKSISARPVSAIEKAWRWCKRRPAVAALAGMLLLTVAGSLVGLSVMLQRSEALRSHAEAMTSNAEKMRLNSEANYEVASQSLDQLLGLFSGELATLQHSTSQRNKQIKALETARSQEIELSERNPLDIRALRRLAEIDKHLADLLGFEGKADEAKRLTKESVGFWERALMLSPKDLDCMIRHLHMTISYVSLTLLDPKDESDYEQWNNRANTLLKQYALGHYRGIWPLFLLSSHHRRHAEILRSRGELDRARRELEVDIKLVRSMSIVAPGCPVVAINDAVTSAALGHPIELVLPRSAIHGEVNTNEDERILVARGLGELTARRVGWLPAIDESTPPIPNTLPPGVWADRVITAMQSDVKMLNIDPARVPAIAYQARGFYSGTLFQLRRAGKLNETKRVVAQLFVLAERMTRVYPDQAYSSMLLCDAYIQRSKNAQRLKNESAIECERKALDAAIRASSLDPQDEKIRQEVQWCRERVKKLEAK